MNIKRLLNTPFGKIIISILLGFGLATMFRKACTDKNCIIFDGPVISEVDGKIFRFGEFCYKYDLQPNKCDPTKKTVEITNPSEKEDNDIPSILKPQDPVKPSSSWF
jgi:hypothetical protein